MWQLFFGFGVRGLELLRCSNVWTARVFSASAAKRQNAAHRVHPTNMSFQIHRCAPKKGDDDDDDDVSGVTIAH